MPLLSELLAEVDRPAAVFGLKVDVDDVTPPEGVREAGLVARFEGGDLDETVLDVAISYILAGVEVTIEVPADAECGSAKQLVSLAASVGASLSLLPPSDPSDEAFESWCTRVDDFALAYATQANMAKFVLPVTSYLEYLVIEALSPEVASRFAPSDPYVVGNYASSVSPERSDAMKARVRAVFEGVHGGPDGLKAFLLAIVSAIHERAEESIRERIAPAPAAS